jgi:hypothetical protein
MTLKTQNVYIRKAQSSREGSLYLNLPVTFTTLVGVKKSDDLNCSIIQQDNRFSLLVSKSEGL